MSSSTLSLVGLSRSSAVAALTRWRPPAEAAAHPAEASANAAPAGRLHRLTQAVQAVAAPAAAAESTTAGTDAAAAGQADPLAQAGLGADDNTAMAQRFAEAVLLALHDSAKRRDDDDDDHGGHGRGRHRGHRHDGEHDHGVHAYRGMDRLASRLQDLASRLRAGDATTPGAPASAAPTTAPTTPEPVVDGTPAPATTNATTNTAASTTTTDPLQSLVQAFTALAPQAVGGGDAQAVSPRERLAAFLDRLAALLAEPRRRGDDDGCHHGRCGQLLNLSA